VVARITRLTLLVATPVAVGVGASLSAAAGPIEGQCNAKAASFLFWPHGHHAIPRIGFPSFPIPHLELYGGLHRASFPPGAEQAYIDATGAAGVARSCRITPAGFINARVNQAKSSTSVHEIECNFKNLVSYRVSRVTGGARLQTVIGGSAVVVDVSMGRSGSQITWDKRYCTAMPPPS